MTESPHQSILDEANRSGAWFAARKVSPVWVNDSASKPSVESLEGEETLLSGDVLCRGAAGDVWPQSRESLFAKYSPTSQVDAQGWKKFEPRPEQSRVMAIQILHPFEVDTTRGKLSGKAGDYLLKKHDQRDIAYPQDVWIVDRQVFQSTYQREPT